MISASKPIDATQVLVKRFAFSEVITHLIICNRSATANTFSLWFVPPNTTLSTDHQTAASIPILGNETIIWGPDEIKMGKDEEIWAQGGTSATLSITLMRE